MKYKFKLKMRKILFIVFAFLGFAFTQPVIAKNVTTTDSTVIQNIHEVERLIDKYSDKTNEGISNMFDKLSKPMKKVYSYSIKLQYVKGFMNVSYPFFAIIMFFLFLKYYKIAKDSNKNDWIQGKFGGLSLMLLIFFVILGILAVVGVHIGVLQLTSPEYFAIKDMIRLLK